MTKILLPFVLVVLGAGLIFAFRSPSQQPKELVETTRTTREVALACDKEMAGGFHIHPVLEIVVNGESVLIPQNIGVRETCMTVLHTHTADGLIHVESPEKRDFTLGDFFAVWEKPFTKDAILSYRTDATHRIVVTIDGVEVDTFENTVLTDDARIVIRYEASSTQ